MSDDEPKRPRRDFLVTAALTTAGAGAALALWPFFAALGPAADIKARRIVFDIANLKGGELAHVSTNLGLLAVFRRTEEELTRLRNSKIAPDRRFHDVEALPSSQPDEANNWHRSLRPEIMVCKGQCTREFCVIRRSDSNVSEELFCPCCGTRYDLAGRAHNGPALRNLDVPRYRYLNATQIEFGDDMHPAWEVTEQAPANPRRWSHT